MIFVVAEYVGALEQGKDEWRFVDAG